MSFISTINSAYDTALDKAKPFGGIPPLLLRLILAPVMIQAGYNKLVSFESTVAWFGNSLGMPLPELMAALAIGAEFLGGMLLLVGLMTRLVAIPLMVTMLVAMLTVHWEHGWLSISDSSSWLANERVMEAAPRKARAIAILREHGNYRWLTEHGSITMLNNGIEFAAMYFVMLLSLLFTGGGRYTSLDHYFNRYVLPRLIPPPGGTQAAPS